MRPSRSMVTRGVAFYTIGALGLGVQLAVLWLLAGVVGVPYLPATAVAVELAVLHNLWWHERWTWRDRVALAGSGAGRGTLLARLARFHAANGLISIWGNVALTGVFVGHLGTGYLTGNLLAVAACALANFVAADRLVYPADPSMHSPGVGPGWARCGRNAGGR